MSTDVTAIIVTYNSARVLPACVAALSAAGVPAIIVDNDSGDDTVTVAECAASNGADVRVIQTGKNLGYGRANNIGVRAATTLYILVINPDVVVQSGAVSTLLAAAESDPAHALCAPKIVEPDGRVFDTRLGPLGPFASGACFLIRRDVFLRLGGFDENIFLFYEDDDLCRRLTDMNMPPVYIEGAVVMHDRGRSTGDHDRDTPLEILVRGEFMRRYHQAWSRFYVLKKYGQSQSVFAWALFYGAKYMSALVTLNKVRQGRYAGSFWGAIDKKQRFG